MIHLRSKLNSAHGTIAIGEGCIIGERAAVGLQGEGGQGVVIGKGVVVEAGARVEGSLGEGSVVEAGGIVGRGASVGKVGRFLILPFLKSSTYSFILVLDRRWTYTDGEQRRSLLSPYPSHHDPAAMLLLAVVPFTWIYSIHCMLHSGSSDQPFR